MWQEGFTTSELYRNTGPGLSPLQNQQVYQSQFIHDLYFLIQQYSVHYTRAKYSTKVRKLSLINIFSLFKMFVSVSLFCCFVHISYNNSIRAKRNTDLCDLGPTRTSERKLQLQWKNGYCQVKSLFFWIGGFDTGDRTLVPTSYIV